MLDVSRKDIQGSVRCLKHKNMSIYTGDAKTEEP